MINFYDNSESCYIKTVEDSLSIVLLFVGVLGLSSLVIDTYLHNRTEQINRTQNKMLSFLHYVIKMLILVTLSH